MSDVVIRSEQLGKKYLIGHQSAERDATFREAITRTMQGLGRSAIDVARGRQFVTGDEVEEFWALKDVSFEIKQGSVVGIIGRNGAGKSTLLKILSRITEPTEGRVKIKGRIASLLEVGTGFHPELSGRENIYLNGSILGMRRAEIRRKFDEIVDFSDIERFLDTPVKRYSSGMYVRLAFAVAAHLEPEILVVDEVLAVGDAEFQKKCLGKMQDVAKFGRTVLFVSHQIAAVERLTHRCLYLQQGRVHLDGEPSSVISEYLQGECPANGAWVFVPRDRVISSTPDTASIEMVRARLVEADGMSKVEISAAGHRKRSVRTMRLSFTLTNPAGTAIGSGFSPELNLHDGNQFEITASMPTYSLAPGVYTVAIAVGRGDLTAQQTNYEVVEPLAKFRIPPLLGDDGTYVVWRESWGNSIFREISARVATKMEGVEA